MRYKTFLLALIAILSFLITVDSAMAQEFKFNVRQDRLIGDHNGELVFKDEVVVFQDGKSNQSTSISYTDIKLIEIPSANLVRIWTYQDKEWLLGKDRSYSFYLLEEKISREVITFIRSRNKRPFLIAFADSEENETPITELAVKHKHRLGGCQGILRIFKDRVSFITSEKSHSREWLWTEIESVSRSDRWQLEILTHEREIGGSEKNYNFALKESLSDESYNFIWNNVFKPTPLIKEDKELFARP
jgi:hypothetical protein